MKYVAGRMVGPHDAEEVAYTVLTKAWLGIDAYDPKRGNVKNWLYQIAVSAAIDAKRHNAVRPAEPTDPAKVAGIGGIKPPEREPGLFDRVLSALGEAVEAPEQREVLIRNVLGGETLEEISEKTNIPAGTVKSRLRLAKQKAAVAPKIVEIRNALLD